LIASAAEAGQAKQFKRCKSIALGVNDIAVCWPYCPTKFRLNTLLEQRTIRHRQQRSIDAG
jgi:hypothetical protein